MKFPVDLELLNAMLGNSLNRFPAYKAVALNYMNRVNQAYDDGKNGIKSGYPITPEEGMKIARASGHAADPDLWVLSSVLRTLTDLCNKAYEQGQKDKR